jgi:hypothetical protein
MKKSILFGLVLIAAATISSCKKDRVCSCEVTTTGLLNLSINVDTTFVDISKADAESKCTGLNASVTDPLFDTTVETVCELD